MNFDRLKEIVNSDIPNDVKKDMILSVLSHDKDALPYIIGVLANERFINTELIKQLNVELSRAEVFIATGGFGNFTKEFVLSQIDAFYQTNDIKRIFNKESK